MKINLKHLNNNEITEMVLSLDQQKYRADQIVNWIYTKNARSIDDMTDLSKDFRRLLKEKAYISNLKILEVQHSADRTSKYLFELEDGETIESVLMEGSRVEDKFTLCISTQVGCAMKCLFCLTGSMGFKRNLYSHEIIDQVIAVQRDLEESPDYDDHPTITNLVFMGMGEPLLNFDETINAISRLTGMIGFSKRKITVSTSGIVPKIHELADRAYGVNLAVSLNATTDELRNRLMPINKKYPLHMLLSACKEFRLPPTRRITFEYVMLDGINDSIADAKRLVRLLSGIKSMVNLILYNSGEIPRSVFSEDTELTLRSSSRSTILSFQKVLQDAQITTIIRKSKGADISAACGQLRGKLLVTRDG